MSFCCVICLFTRKLLQLASEVREILGSSMRFADEAVYCLGKPVDIGDRLGDLLARG